ncbi:MAG: O-antigen ligase family protein [Solirubrobacteraceae bacterium]
MTPGLRRGAWPPALLAGLTIVVAGAAFVSLLAAGKIVDSIGYVLLAGVATAAAVILVSRPRLLLGAYVSLFVLVEGTTDAAFLPSAGRIYDPVLSKATPLELLLALLVVAVVIQALQEREFELPGPLTPVLLLALAALVFGAVTGWFGGTGISGLIEAARRFVPLILLPFLVVNIVRTPQDVRRALALVAVLAVVKGLLGLAGVALGRGPVLDSGGTVLTYYEPLANWLTILYIFGVASAVLARVRVPWYAWIGGFICLASLVLSFRRSFWLAAAIGIAFILLIGIGRAGRLVVIPAIVAIGLGIYVSFSIGGVELSQPKNPVLARVLSLNPTQLAANREDRYRLDERRNVTDELKAHPITGLGLGVPWAATHPLSQEFPQGRLYVHFTVLWWWLNLGILGLAAYAALMGTLLVLTFRVWKTRGPPFVRIPCLALFGGIIGLMFAETTASFTGVDARFTLGMGCVVGLVAALHRTAGPWLPGRDAPAPAAGP